MKDTPFYSFKKPITIGEICELLDLEIPLNLEPTQIFNKVDTLLQADESSISLLHNSKYAKDAASTKAGLCITSEELAHHIGPHTAVLSHKDPYRAYAKIVGLMYQVSTIPENTFIHPSACIDETASIAENCYIGPYVVIGAHVSIGARSRIEGHTVIQNYVSIGEEAVIGNHVSISHSLIGRKVLIKPGARIGQQGFGFHMDEKGHFDVPQIGIVEIGNDVQIGSNTCIDRGGLGNTIICDGVRIDNLVQIAHNVYIGPMSVIVAQAGIAGSTKLGKFVVLAGQVGIAGHLTIGDFVKVAAQSGLMRNVETGDTVAGSPAVPVRDWHKQTIILQQLVKEKKNGSR